METYDALKELAVAVTALDFFDCSEVVIVMLDEAEIQPRCSNHGITLEDSAADIALQASSTMRSPQLTE